MSSILLPTVIAVLNAMAAVCLVIGFVLVKRGHRRAHRVAMITALVFSAGFLVTYIVHHAQVGSVPYQGTGPIRTLYFVILISHVALAATVPVLAIVTVRRAMHGAIDRHRAIARWTLPIWLYVSVTGVVIYWMVYR